MLRFLMMRERVIYLAEVKHQMTDAYLKKVHKRLGELPNLLKDFKQAGYPSGKDVDSYRFETVVAAELFDSNLVQDALRGKLHVCYPSGGSFKIESAPEHNRLIISASGI